MVHLFPGRFAGKIVAITGGGGGVGAAMAKRYLAEGAKVLIADLHQTQAADTIKSAEAGTVHYHQCDLSTADGATSVVSETVARFGGIDIIHNNASAMPWGKVDEMDPSVWTHSLRVGLDAPFWIVRAAIPEMKKRGGGSIVNTLSSCAFVGDAGLSCYGAAKAGLMNMTRAMAIDYAPDNIRVNAVAPGWTNTPMAKSLSATPQVKKLVAASTPMARPADPSEIAAVGLFLASDDASFVTGASMFTLLQVSPLAFTRLDEVQRLKLR